MSDFREADVFIDTPMRELWLRGQAPEGAEREALRVQTLAEFNVGLRDEHYDDTESLPAIGGAMNGALIDPFACDGSGLLLAFRTDAGAVYQLCYTLVEKAD